mmetsp:Transcript_30633/g.33479  ORF Transcript_30633/g.33479 Transcript_30633/m.33479 type:complete len:497 (-) Transcript_30633:16-1506(-)|eukprot:gene13251-14552_t
MSSITARRRLLETVVRDGTPLGRFRPLEIGIQSSVRTLNLAQPNIGNPINSTLANQVSRAIDKQNQNENGKLIIFHSTQPNIFSKGLETASQTNLKAANRLRKAIQRAQPATIAVYDGVVENAGYSAFADSDYLVGTETTRFAIKGFASGKFPFGAGLLARIIRKKKNLISVARYLTLTEREIDAVDMSDLQLVDFVTPTRPQEAIVFALEQTVPTEGDRVEVLRSQKTDLMLAQLEYLPSDEMWQHFQLERKYGPDSRLPANAPFSTMPMHYRYQTPHIDTSGEMLERILNTLDLSWTEVTDDRVNPFDKPVSTNSTQAKDSSGMNLLQVTESEQSESVDDEESDEVVEEEKVYLDDILDNPETDVLRGTIARKSRSESLYAKTKGGQSTVYKHHSQRRLSELYPLIERFFGKASTRLTIDGLRKFAQHRDTRPDQKAWAEDTLQILSKVPPKQVRMLYDFTSRLQLAEEDPLEEELKLLNSYYDDAGLIRSDRL